MFFTRRGDDGYTDLLGGPRMAKDALRIAILGDIDEATSAIGLGRAFAKGDDTKATLLHVQKELYELMTDIATVAGKGIEHPHFGQAQMDSLEAHINTYDGRIDIPKEFVAPGDTVPGAAIDVARAVVRRAERTATHLLREGDMGVTQAMVAYLNRLSSLLFGLARYEDSLAGASARITKEIE
jgi:cob(I)alamin adenosyltransferase